MALIPSSRSLLAFAGLVVLASLQSTGAYDPLDPFGSIAVKWDIITWTGDGYTATVSMYNTQQFRGIQNWHLGWTWAKKEVIWTMVGAQATEQGDCSGLPAPPPHSCMRNPTIIDLVPGVPYAQQVNNCCRNGVISALAQDPVNSVSSFSITVGKSGNTNITVLIPEKLTLKSPQPGYTCSDLQKVTPTRFPQNNGKRFTQAYLTWNATCTYSQYLAQKAPTCCVSLSAFYSSDIVKCPDCACSCSPNVTKPGINALPGTDQTCIGTDTNYKNLPSVENGATNNGLSTTPELYCTNDMCPVKIHWHIKENYVNYWRAKVTITNRNFNMNYSDWNIVVQHENFENFTEAFSFTAKPLTPYGDVVNDTAMFWGVQYYNEMLLQAGPMGNVQSELLFAKDSRFTWTNGWGFPSRIYFNGDDCVLPEPQDYPQLPNSGHKAGIGLPSALSLLLAIVLSFCLSL